MTIENDFFQVIDDANLGYLVAWPGVDFTPPDSGIWIEPVVIRGDGIDIGLPMDSVVLPNGTLRVGVIGRPGNGVVSLFEAAETIASVLVKGTRFQDGSFISTNPIVGSVIIEQDKLIVPVSMSFGM